MLCTMLPPCLGVTSALFSEVEIGDGKLAILFSVATGIGAALQWVYGRFTEWRAEKRARDERNESNIVTHQKALIDRIDAEKKSLERERCEAEVERDDAIEKKHAARLSKAIALRHIKYLELLLTREGIHFEEFVEEGSSVHTPLPKPDPCAPYKTDANGPSDPKTTDPKTLDPKISGTNPTPE